MTPKEKAIELWLSYYELIDDCYSSKAAKGIAKQFALIAVDEMIKLLVDLSNNNFTYLTEVMYYQKVKQELEKL
jgi:hypothetical protein